MADRTPIEVTLSSDDEDAALNQDPDIIMERRKKRRPEDETAAEKKKERTSVPTIDEYFRKNRDKRTNPESQSDIVDVEKEDQVRTSSRWSTASSSSPNSSAESDRREKRRKRKRGLSSAAGESQPRSEVDVTDTVADNSTATAIVSSDVETLKAIEGTEVVIGDSDYEDDDDDDIIIESEDFAVGATAFSGVQFRRDWNDENSRSSSTQTPMAPHSVLRAKVWDFLESARREREQADRERQGRKENWDAEEEEAAAAAGGTSGGNGKRKRNSSGGQEHDVADEHHSESSSKKKRSSTKGKGKGKGKSSCRKREVEEGSNVEDSASGSGGSSSSSSGVSSAVIGGDDATPDNHKENSTESDETLTVADADADALSTVGGAIVESSLDRSQNLTDTPMDVDNLQEELAKPTENISSSPSRSTSTKSALTDATPTTATKSTKLKSVVVNDDGEKKGASSCQATSPDKLAKPHTQLKSVLAFEDEMDDDEDGVETASNDVKSPIKLKSVVALPNKKHKSKKDKDRRR